MIKEEFKNKAYELRKLGKSYNFIIKELGIPKSTLSYWFHYLSWSGEIRGQNLEKIKEESTKRIALINKARKELANKQHLRMREEAEREFEKYKNNPIFIGALMLYLGEGDKSLNTGHIRMGNVDPYVLKIFTRFLAIFCNINTQKIRFWLLCYPDHDTEMCLNWWAKSLKMSRNQFYKTQVIQGRHKEKKLLYGVGNITITSTFLKTKVLRWVELMSENLAAMV